MTSHEAVGRAGEAAIGEQGDRVAESGAVDGGGDSEHFAHAGTSARAFVTNDNHVPGNDLPAFDGCKGLLFAVKHARRTPMMLNIVTCNLHHAAIGGEVPPENDQASSLFDGTISTANNLLPRS